MEEKDVYICYNRADTDWVLRLAEQLESETIDGKPDSRRLRVFFDRWDIDHGDSLIDAMNTGIKNARHIATVLSPEFLEAEWPRFEWKHVLADDPNNAKGKIVPLLRRDICANGARRIDLCAPFRDLKYVDFRQDGEFRKSCVELVRRIRRIPPVRGRSRPPIAPATATAVLPEATDSLASWLPDVEEELLLSNLFSVRKLPSVIWGGKTDCNEKMDIWTKVESCSPFILRSGKLFTFADLNNSDEPLGKVVSGAIEKIAVNDWVFDESRRNWLMDLLNCCMSQHLRNNWIKPDRKGRHFFLPAKEGKNRVYQMDKNQRPRTVAKKITNVETNHSFWVHHAARIKFKKIGERLYLGVEPMYLFTENGLVHIKGKQAGKYSQMWAGKQQNPDILRNVLFWGFVLANRGKSIRLETGGERIQIDSIPAGTRISRGIRFDSIQIKTLMSYEARELDDAANQIDDIDEIDDENEEEADQA